MLGIPSLNRVSFTTAHPSTAPRRRLAVFLPARARCADGEAFALATMAVCSQRMVLRAAYTLVIEGR